ncbi:unnamed protein product [Ambrosiozyma monospora]|uniref:Unnamed protein product n=1 Tax=Ambrosiozyma monospora TaxID=43982 RepID=A0ACB5TPD9_AMBMO|nr:unnamed protein product [Ambrosiozyma monospora]
MSKHPDVRIAEYVKSTIISVFEDKYEASFTSPEPTSFFESRSSISLLTKDYKIPHISHTGLDHSTPFSLESMHNQGLKMFQKAENNELMTTERTTRLQLLFYMEMRFWKSLRQKIKSFLVPIFTSNLKSRSVFAEQILEILPVLEHMNSIDDREYALSLLEHFRLQIYYDPKIGTDMLKKGLLSNVFFSCLHLFSPDGQTNTNEFVCDPSSSSWESKRWIHGRDHSYDVEDVSKYLPNTS